MTTWRLINKLCTNWPHSVFFSIFQDLDRQRPNLHFLANFPAAKYTTHICNWPCLWQSDQRLLHYVQVNPKYRTRGQCSSDPMILSFFFHKVKPDSKYSAITGMLSEPKSDICYFRYDWKSFQRKNQRNEEMAWFFFIFFLNRNPTFRTLVCPCWPPGAHDGSGHGPSWHWTKPKISGKVENSIQGIWWKIILFLQGHWWGCEIKYHYSVCSSRKTFLKFVLF